MIWYEKSFKEEAVRLSDDIGVKQAAAQLGIPHWTLAEAGFPRGQALCEAADGHHPGAMQRWQAVHLPDHGLFQR